MFFNPRFLLLSHNRYTNNTTTTTTKTLLLSLFVKCHHYCATTNTNLLQQRHFNRDNSSAHNKNDNIKTVINSMTNEDIDIAVASIKKPVVKKRRRNIRRISYLTDVEGDKHYLDRFV